ncbi:MAG: acetate--CoA ligase family protein [Pusillimonas sp.]
MQKTSFAQALLSPRRIALVGASGDISKNTARPLLFMRKHGFSGTVYPINPSRSEILGERAYPDLASLPEPVDHVFVMVPGRYVLDLLGHCAAAGAKVVTVYSDGFGESGEEGVKLQAQLVVRAQELGLRILGPNSIGLADIQSGGIISVNAAFDAKNLLPGNISMVSQSGSMMGSLLSRAAARGFGFAKSISVGNESDISVGEVINALVDDPQTEIILLFLETVREAAIMAAALRRAHAANKPVVVYKLGRSDQGNVLSQSHTGAIAGNDAAVDAFFRAHGVMRVQLLETLFEIVPLATRYAKSAPRAKGVPRVAVITTTGGGAATVVDNLGVCGIQAVTPPEFFIKHMAEHGLKLRPSPIIDLTLAATSAQYKKLLEELLAAPWCDAVLSVVGSSAQFHPDLAVRPLIEASKPDNKPLVAFLAPNAPESLALLQQHSIASFQTPEACADALASFLRRGKPVEPPAGEEQTTFSWPDNLPRKGPLTEYEAGLVLSALGIELAQTQLVSPQDLHHTVPYPVVIKVCSRDIQHKTEVQGVRVGITDDDDLARQVPEMLRSIKRHCAEASIAGVLIQKMEDRLIEVILGFQQDPLVGPIIMLGAGGIAAELSKDFSLRLAPVDEATAQEMINEVKLTQLVRGYRGQPLGDCNALATAIVRFSRLATVQGVQINEAEINPLFVRREGAIAVDALMRLF